MTFETHPSATAGFGPFPISYPAATIYSNNFESESTGWAAGTGSTAARNMYQPRNGSWAFQLTRASTAGVAIAQRTFTGLMVGRPYTFAAYVGRDNGGVTAAALGVTGIGTGTAVTPDFDSSTTPVSYTFTATASTHVLTIQTTHTSATSQSSTWDDVSLTANAYTDPNGTTTLPISEGDLSLDKSRVPFGNSTVTVPLQNAVLAEQLNPFASQRVKIKAAARGHWDKTTPELGDYSIRRTNLFGNPRATTVSSTYWSASAGSLTARTDYPAAVTTNVRYTRTSTAAGRITLNVGTTMPGAGQHLHVQARLRSSVAISGVQVVARALATTATGQTVLGTLNIPAGVSDFDLYGVSFTGTPTTSSGINLIFPSGVASGVTVDITTVLIESGTIGNYFDGSIGTINTQEYYAWAGAADASPSTFVRREIVAEGNPFWVPDDEREFNFVMSSREVSHDGKTVQLRLDTDEAILQRYAPLADDLGALDRQSSLRSIINYVLNKAIPGAALETGGAADRPFRVSADAINMIPDPRATGSAGIYGQANVATAYDTTWPGTQEGVGHNGFHLYSPSGTDGYLNVGPGGQMALGMQAGRTYTFSAEGSVRSTMGGETGDRHRRLVVHTWEPTIGYRIWMSPPIPTTVQTGQTPGTRVDVTWTVPAAAQQVFLRAYHGGTSGTISWSKFRLSERHTYPGSHNSDYFWGSRPSTSEYAYSWTGTADQSTSRRVALINRAPELLVWKAGTSAWSFLETLKNAAGLRLFCDEQRRWWLVDRTEYTVPGRINVRVDNASAGTDSMDASGDRAVQGVIARFTWRDNNGNSVTRDDFAGTAGRVQVVEFDRPYPGPGTAAAILVKLTGAGRKQDVTVGADLSVTPGQEISITLPGTADQLGQLEGVKWNLTDGVMDLTSAGLREVTPGSWLAQTEDRTWANRPDTTIWQNASDS